jgi:TRAP-type C4-dicarboxylate transport system substrate-binding protein
VSGANFNDLIPELIERETANLSAYGDRRYHTVEGANAKSDRIHGQIDVLSVMLSGTVYSDLSDHYRAAVTDALREAIARIQRA